MFSLFLIPKTPDTPLQLLPSARNRRAVDGVKLQQTAATCLWEKMRICPQQTLCGGLRAC